MTDLQNRPDPSTLLEAFLDSKRSEKAFTRLVEDVSGLVFSCALRRTRDRGLAEEITQNVFAILARKAETLRGHPCLTAWILETTRIEAANALRAENRRRRKISAFTAEAEAQRSDSPDDMDHKATWQDAAPILDDLLHRLPAKERKVVLQRFYEGKKFREIAAENGQTEGAAKMRIKRSLEKLSRMLTARGVTLSATVLASALGTELARSAPLKAASLMASKALAASPGISTTAILANTFATMSTAKTTTITAAAVLAIVAIPFSRQLAEGSRIRSELQTISSQRSIVTKEPGKSKRSRRAAPDRSPGPRTAQSILATLDQPADNRALIGALISGESLGEAMAWGRITKMSPEEIGELLDDLQRFPCDGPSKDLLASRISDYAPEQSPRDRLERMVAAGRHSTVQRHMQEWAISDPDAALAWYREQRASGGLDPGLKGELHERVLTSLVVGLAESGPEKALQVYTELPREEFYTLAPTWMATALAKEIIRSGDETHFARLFEMHKGEEKDRKGVLEGVVGEFARNGRFDDGVALLDRYNPGSEERNYQLELLFRRSLAFDQLEGGIDWLLSSIPEAQNPDVMRRMVYAFASRSRTIAKGWAERQEPGMIRDATYAAIADRMAFGSEYQEAFTNAESIDDATLRAETRLAIERLRMKRARERAEKGLPPEMMDDVRNQ